MACTEPEPTELAVEVKEENEEPFTQETFSSIQSLLLELSFFDMTVISNSPLRLWKHDPKKKSLKTGWSAGPTQLDAGAKLQISRVMKVSGVKSKGWNEQSEYFLGLVSETEWVTLINFRGAATVVPDMDAFTAKYQSAKTAIDKVQGRLSQEVSRREEANQRIEEYEVRLSESDERRKQADKNVEVIEEQMQKIKDLSEEKVKASEDDISVAKREALEARILSKYFEQRYQDLNTTLKRTEKHLEKDDVRIRDLEKRLAVTEAREGELKKALEEDELKIVELTRQVGIFQGQGPNEDSEGKTPRSKKDKKRHAKDPLKKEKKHEKKLKRKASVVDVKKKSSKKKEKKASVVEVKTKNSKKEEEPKKKNSKKEEEPKKKNSKKEEEPKKKNSKKEEEPKKKKEEEKEEMKEKEEKKEVEAETEAEAKKEE